MTRCGLEYTGLEILTILQEARNYNRYLADLCVQAAGSTRTACDFGAGIGTFAQLVRERGFEVRCVEADLYLIDRLGAEGFKAVRTLSEIPEASVEFVFSLNVFEHIADDAAVLSELAGKLQPGGRCLIYVPAFEVLWSALDDRVEHHRRYTRASLSALIAQAGLKVERCRYADVLGFLGVLLFKWLGNRNGNLSPAAVRNYDRWIIPLSLALDKICSPFFGKNVYAICRKA